MNERDVTRRSFVSVVAASALPLVPPSADSGAARLTVVCVGGHPDDPESGCGGTLARYAALGHAVTVVYLTRGERGISGKSLDEAARIRSAECATACKIMGAKPVFVVFTHWPVDTHMDHQVASVLTIRAWMEGDQRTSRLYFFEVNSGSQTEGFLPNTYVDISSVVQQKKAALFAHVSQDGQGIWREHHEIMAQWRGREIGVRTAEAFVHLNRDDHSSDLTRLQWWRALIKDSPPTPHTHDDRYHQHLHEPVTGMDPGHLPGDVFPEDRSRENDDREPDPQQQAEVDRAHPVADAQERHEARDHTGEDEAPRQ